MRTLLPLLLAVVAGTAHAAPGAGLRLGLEGGVAWFYAHPDEGTAPAAAIRLRSPLTERLSLGLGLLHLRRGTGGDAVAATMAPLTIDLLLDEAPIAPRIGGGLALLDVDGAGRGWGPVFGAGADWNLDDTFALTAQIQWIGHSRASFFPWYSALTLGLSARLF